jgi:hypothetical protein
MASLCKTCQSIPFKNLPLIPDGVGQCTPEEMRNIHQLHRHESDTNAEVLSVGWTHPKSLVEMIAETEVCVLCKLFADARVQLARDYAAAKEDEKFVTYVQSQGLADNHLGLLASPDGSDGFMAIVRAKESWLSMAPLRQFI